MTLFVLRREGDEGERRGQRRDDPGAHHQRRWEGPHQQLCAVRAAAPGPLVGAMVGTLLERHVPALVGDGTAFSRVLAGGGAI